MPPAVQKVMNDKERNCDSGSCHKPIEIGEHAIKHYRIAPLKHQWHHEKCWGEKK